MSSCCGKCCMYFWCPCLLCIPSSSPSTTKNGKPVVETKQDYTVSTTAFSTNNNNTDVNRNSNTNTRAGPPSPDGIPPSQNPAYGMEERTKEQQAQQEIEDYNNLLHVAHVREIRVTIRKGTQAGIAAGLSVTAGTIVAGPIGAVAGGVLGTAMATKIAKNVVPLATILEQTPVHQRHAVLLTFNEAFREEFSETVNDSPELKLLLSGKSIFSVVRYMVDRNLIKEEKLKRLDWILSDSKNSKKSKKGEEPKQEE